MNEDFALKPIQVSLLWNLLFTGDEPKLSDLKPGIKPPERNHLRDSGLIEVEKRKGVSKTGRKSNASHVVLTDAAWKWAAENLDTEFSMRANCAPALRGLLVRLKAYVDANGVPLAELLSPPPEAVAAQDAPAELPERIRAAYTQASGGQSQVRVKLADLRRLLPDVPREALDAGLLGLQESGALSLYPNNDPWDLRPEDRDAAIDILGEKRHIVYMRGA